MSKSFFEKNKKNYAATFRIKKLEFTALCSLHVFLQIFDAVFRKWTFLFFEKCLKSKPAIESRNTFFLGSLLTLHFHLYFI